MSSAGASRTTRAGDVAQDVSGRDAARDGASAELADPTAALCDAIVALEAPDEASRFLKDLCTPAEIRALAERWHAACLLNEGGLSYREIHDRTGVSTTTITRVARFLHHEPHQGYRLILDRLNRAPEKD